MVLSQYAEWIAAVKLSFLICRTNLPLRIASKQNSPKARLEA